MRHVFQILTFAALVDILYSCSGSAPSSKPLSDNTGAGKFITPDTTAIPNTPEGRMIRYGRKLIANTSKYLGPNGSEGHYLNNMNCQNCHLDAGTRPFGNNYLSVHSTYPRHRERSGNIETEVKRVTDCMERSLNGKAVAPDSKEMLAILSYLRWVGTGVEIGSKAEGSGLKDISLLNRAADTGKGKLVYIARCQVCHGKNGEGVALSNNIGYQYPPLWGTNSYNEGAGLFRISNFAKFVKYNMPYGTSYTNSQLSDEEAWDVAAFVNSQPRPANKSTTDWPAISKKPFDHPFGPYADGFSETQHKYGPFQDIIQKKEVAKK
jgi:thiosulfate dehydrogenase